MQFTNRLKAMIARLFGYNVNKDREEVVHELAEFLRLDPALVKKLLPKGTYLSAEEWKRIVKRVDVDLYDFYSQSEYYIFDLCYGNYWNIGTYVGMILIAMNSKGRILDYGGGVGSQLIISWRTGLRDLTYYDIKGRIFDFAKYRFERRGMRVNMVEASDTEDKLGGTYDTIYCREVLEHVRDPFFHLERLDEHLVKKGRLFLSYHFEKDENHPMHFSHVVNVDKWFRDRGYEAKCVKLFSMLPLKRLRIYVK
jgi:2-polyprenyl-3-methyl-5-hydroxy-6-metoxy-1,4-benzoquinol methylase